MARGVERAADRIDAVAMLDAVLQVAPHDAQVVVGLLQAQGEVLQRLADRQGLTPRRYGTGGWTVATAGCGGKVGHFTLYIGN